MYLLKLVWHLVLLNRWPLRLFLDLQVFPLLHFRQGWKKPVTCLTSTWTFRDCVVFLGIPQTLQVKPVLSAFCIIESIIISRLSRPFAILLPFVGNLVLALSPDTKTLVTTVCLRSTVRLRFRKSIAGHHFQNTRKLANNDFQYHYSPPVWCFVWRTSLRVCSPIVEFS